jgi:hypothetical protein
VFAFLCDAVTAKLRGFEAPSLIPAECLSIGLGG